MHAWTVAEFGPYKTAMKWAEIGRPEFAGRDPVIRVKAAGLNFPDILCVAGKYQVRPPLPFVAGTECMGEVVEAAPDSGYKSGDRVMTMAGVGAFGEYCVAPRGTSFKVPDGMTDEDAAAFQMTYQTSYFGVKVRADLQPGEVLLVHGGAGGVGSAAIQLGKMLGATVIATASSPEKLEVCRGCGADHVINYVTEDFVEGVKELTGGKGADVIYDPVGGDVFDQSTKCINWNGRLLVIGFTSGRIPEIKVNRVLLKNISIVGLHWGQYRAHQPELIEQAQAALYEAYAQKKIKPVIWKTYSMKQLPEAMEAMERRECYGKVVLKP
jgi:NADPH2:quinone reductase